MDSAEIISHTKTTYMMNYKPFLFSLLVAVGFNFMELASELSFAKVIDNVIRKEDMSQSFVILGLTVYQALPETLYEIFIILVCLKILQNTLYSPHNQPVSVTLSIKLFFSFIYEHSGKCLQIFLLKSAILFLISSLIDGYKQLLIQSMTLNEDLMKNLQETSHENLQEFLTKAYPQLKVNIHRLFMVVSIQLLGQTLTLLLSMFSWIVIHRPQINCLKALWVSLKTMLQWDSLKLYIALHLRLWWVWMILPFLISIQYLAITYFYFQCCHLIFEKPISKQNDNSARKAETHQNQTQQQQQQEEINEIIQNSIKEKQLIVQEEKEVIQSEQTLNQKGRIAEQKRQKREKRKEQKNSKKQRLKQQDRRKQKNEIIKDKFADCTLEQIMNHLFVSVPRYQKYRFKFHKDGRALEIESI